MREMKRGIEFNVYYLHNLERQREKTYIIECDL